MDLSIFTALCRLPWSKNKNALHNNLFPRILFKKRRREKEPPICIYCIVPLSIGYSFLLSIVVFAVCLFTLHLFTKEAERRCSRTALRIHALVAFVSILVSTIKHNNKRLISKILFANLHKQFETGCTRTRAVLKII